MKKAFITGITGQDGSYLAELLLAKGYEVHGLVRRASTFNTSRIDHIRNRLTLHYGDLSDAASLHALVRVVRPDELYNLAAQSHVQVSFEMPEYTADVDGVGVVRLLEAIRSAGTKTRFYQASTSEIFGQVTESPQTETTRLYPRSPYGAAKAFAFHMTQNYREAYGIFACNGILYNHESERRGENFVTRKITRSVGRILAGTQDKLALGNLSAKRDWGYAPDYVEAMWRMLQAETPQDFVIATGENHSVREFVELAFQHAGLSWERYVVLDDRHMRPAEVPILLGDASKAKNLLGWTPTVRFHELVRKMVDHDVELARREVAVGL